MHLEAAGFPWQTARGVRGIPGANALTVDIHARSRRRGQPTRHSSCRALLGLEPVGDYLLVDPAVPIQMGEIQLLDIPGRWDRWTRLVWSILMIKRIRCSLEMLLASCGWSTR